jgi:uncharacterized protein YbjT (DUF2867 family)
MRTAMIAGSTGLVGTQLLQLILKDPHYDSIVTVTRKPESLSDVKHKNLVVDFDALDNYGDQLIADDVFCCLGTTMKKAKSKEAFYKVDHDYAVNLARLTHARQAKQFLLVSALGADTKSSFYYNEVKGKTEESIDALNFSAYHIFRPSLLLGPRNENRPGEEAAKTFYRIFNFLIPARYKGIEAAKVAAAMLHYAKAGKTGKHIHDSADLQRF